MHTSFFYSFVYGGVGDSHQQAEGKKAHPLTRDRTEQGTKPMTISRQRKQTVAYQHAMEAVMKTGWRRSPQRRPQLRLFILDRRLDGEVLARAVDS